MTWCASRWRRARCWGVVPQELALYEDLSAQQNLRFFGQLSGLRGSELDGRIDETLEFIDLRERKDERVRSYSGGMKRRLNIGIGLLHQPQLVYMDEPTVGVDPQNRRRILDTVLRLRAERDMTLLYTTHLMEEAQELSDRVGIIDHGKLIAEGTVGELVLRAGEQDRLEIDLGEGGRGDERLLQQLEENVPGVTRVQFAGTDGDAARRLVVHADRGRQVLAPLISALGSAGLELRSVAVQEPDLETVFLQLTGARAAGLSADVPASATHCAQRSLPALHKPRLVVADAGGAAVAVNDHRAGLWQPGR